MACALTLSTKLSPFPYAALAIAIYTIYPSQAEFVWDDGATEPVLVLNDSKITSEDAIVQALAKVGGLADDSAKSQAFFALAKKIQTITAVPELLTILDSLDDHLAFRTFLVGHDITAADWMIWGAIKGSVKALGLLKNNKHPHLSRFLSYFESLQTTETALSLLAAEKASGRRSNKVAASFALGLQDAVDGHVVTRFPPEPSGYLHIGHAKAAILNQYFAKMYHGKLLIRFDDTNPTKERSEFEETILEDLALLDIHGDAISHTSDYFDKLYELGVKMIETGKAYADDTVQEQMRAERMDGIASKHRDDSVEDNLKHFAEMKAGTEEGLRWCIRAKISVDNPNKALRDPVIYRCNVLTHHRTGDKWKIYPTYDFACPVVDSLEGVTHALRTNEYRDRNPQYHWMIEALGLRSVHIWDFSRLNFIYTLLSKRKLHWFVDNGLVKGWDDPRFPTVRGIRRRGMTVEALRQFMLAQGPSQAIVSLEWDSIWAANKKVIDPIAPRFWAITTDKMVPVTIRGGPASAEVKSLPKHKKNPEVGEKQTVYTSQILVEQEDALSFGDNEEITLMDWGNAIVRSKTADPSGTVAALELELHLAGDFRKTSKKIHWLPQPSSAPESKPVVAPVTLFDYDYLITKKKLEENDELKDFVTPVTEFREEALADANVLELKKGDIIQFERKGYFILDQVYADANGEKRFDFIRIPDGKAANLASKAGAKAGEKAPSGDMQKGIDTPVETKMYKMPKVYGEDDVIPKAETKMYPVKNIYSP
ncbi:glutamyl-tRNA synthetase [Gloeophyllum trabeum ATCC 11539]|uniref:glutamate--tRNA ligase n=1 Tax=Gloeophyllum trabeum (strain ATCC 11539 / FP-39264 / Madison 617) TaxID=670483 RepID=S7RWY9_GLOTA|nr:glutamyl-tRNA synthetase [Gloeophyllum trabeum ATCC 11539]EPQ57869.1 glutamyl-tRNA synthetase [Gloeophyllum trabeum ATCC 11539]